MPSSRSHNLVVPLLAVALVAGCDEGPRTVRTYEVPKESVPAALPMTTDPSAVMESPPAAVPMAWELPAGWETAPNTNSMRFATLVAGEGDGRIEIAISSLAGPAGGVPANVNRWRGQIGLPPATDEELAQIVMPVEARGTSGVVVDLVGPEPEADGEATRMFAAIFPTATDTWFIKTTATASALEAQRDAFLALCASVSFDAPAPSAPSDVATGGSGGTEPRWGDPPAGWTADATPAPMSVASFTIGGADGEARMTVTPLGGAQDLLANVNRWRGQAGLAPAATLGETSPEAITIGADPGVLVDIAGSTHIVGAVAERGGTTWYFKLFGPDPLVAEQLAAFRSFLDTVRFE